MKLLVYILKEASLSYGDVKVLEVAERLIGALSPRVFWKDRGESTPRVPESVAEGDLVSCSQALYCLSQG